MSSRDLAFTEFCRILRAIVFASAIFASARELSTYAAQGNKVVADFNREVAAQNVNELQRLFREHKEE